MGGLSSKRLLRAQNETFLCMVCDHKTAFDFKTWDFSIRILYYKIPPPSWLGWTGASCQREKRGNCTLKIPLKSCSVHFILRSLEENLGSTGTTYTKLEGSANPWRFCGCIGTQPAYFCYRLVSILILFLLHK